MPIQIKDAQVSGIWVTLYVCIGFFLVTDILKKLCLCYNMKMAVIHSYRALDEVVVV